jgi:hypothetical protein
MSTLRERIREYIDPKPNPRARSVSDSERANWFDEAIKADHKPMKPRTKQEITRYLSGKNPVRMRRLRKDFKWMQKMMVKLELNPEDARWLL